MIYRVRKVNKNPVNTGKPAGLLLFLSSSSHYSHNHSLSSPPPLLLSLFSQLLPLLSSSSHYSHHSLSSHDFTTNPPPTSNPELLSAKLRDQGSLASGDMDDPLLRSAKA
ncbi:hypothetical protein PZA11_006885 [Diplocarpon coronariae]